MFIFGVRLKSSVAYKAEGEMTTDVFLVARLSPAQFGTETHL